MHKLLTLFALLPLAICAQRTDTLREAHATAQRLRPAPVVQHQLDSAAIMRQSISSLADALRRLPGVILRDYGGAGGLKTVSIHGFGATHTQMLIDGLPVSNAQQGAIDISHYFLEDFSRIGITIADAPLLLTPVRSGANYSLVCETLPLGLENPTPAFRNSPSSSGKISLTHSSWRGWEPAGHFSHIFRHSTDSSAVRATRLDASARYSHARNDFPYSFGGAHLRRTNSRSSSFNTQVSTLTTLPLGALRSSARFWQTQRQLPGPVIYYNPDPSSEQTSDKEAVASLHFRSRPYIEKRRFHPAFFSALRYTWQQSHYTNPSPMAVGPHRQFYDQHEAYLTSGVSLHLLPWLSAAYAADYSLQTLSSNLPTDNAVLRHALDQSLSAEIALRHLLITARLQHHLIRNVVRSAPAPAHSLMQRATPSVTLSYQPIAGLQLRAYYKEYFRPPTFSELYYYHLGTPTLKPELTRQTGIGLTLDKNHALPGRRTSTLAYHLSLSGYAGHVRQRIVSIPYNLYIWRTQNYDSVRTAGVDFLGEMVYSYGRHRLSLSTNYAFLHAAIHAPTSPSPYQLPYAPRHTGAASIAWENPWACAAVSLTAAAERWTTLLHAPTTLLPRYHEVNFSLWHRFALSRPGSALTLRGEAINLTNRHYFVLARYPMPGASYKLTLMFNF